MRETIVQAASRCIVERGHAALSTRAVAAEAGVNQSLIHYYFGTKERLTLAVLERMNLTLLKRQAEMFESDGQRGRQSGRRPVASTRAICSRATCAC